MARALQREDPEQDRDREPVRAESPLRLGEHGLDLGQVVQRLGHDQVGAGGELALEAVPLGCGVGGRRVEGAGDGESGRLADRAPGGVLAAVEPRQDLDQPDRIDVPDAGAGRVVADPWRIAGQRQDVADAQRVGAQQLRFEGHQVPVAGREVDEALEVQVVLDPECDRQRAHPDAGHRRVADVDEVDAGLAQEPGGLDRALDPDRARRVDLDGDDVAAARRAPWPDRSADGGPRPRARRRLPRRRPSAVRPGSRSAATSGRRPRP